MGDSKINIISKVKVQSLALQSFNQINKVYKLNQKHCIKLNHASKTMRAYTIQGILL